jgi:hypothetical protein
MTCIVKVVSFLELTYSFPTHLYASLQVPLSRFDPPAGLVAAHDPNVR